MELLDQGAEAILFREGSCVRKERRPKSYRIPALDQRLRKLRTRHEARILDRLARAGIPVPAVEEVDERTSTLRMQYLDGPKVRDALDVRLGAQIGKVIAQMHNAQVVHQDLTTSNMILQDRIVLIDFGLSFVSDSPEDKAVDLHLLERALAAKHHDLYHDIWKAVLASYKAHAQDVDRILERLSQVNKRGRHKH